MSQTAYVLVRIRPGAQRRLAEHLTAFPDVTYVDPRNGTYDAVLAVAGGDGTALSEVVADLDRHQDVTHLVTCTPPPSAG